MTAVTPIGRERTRCELVVVWLLRRWAMSRAKAEPVLPGLVALVGDLRACPQAAVALASMFQLTEALLTRPLAPARSCDSLLSSDERAVLVLLAKGESAGSVTTVRTVPHGLPGVLVWAVRAARVALADVALDVPSSREWKPLAACPFL